MDWTDVRLGGTIARASFVRVRNMATGFAADGHVNYREGKGTWFADVSVLVRDLPTRLRGAFRRSRCRRLLT